jgi:hypothetical protein
VVAAEGRERTQGAVMSASTLRARFPPTQRRWSSLRCVVLDVAWSSLYFRRRLLLPRIPSQQYHADSDVVLRRLAAADAGGERVLAEAAVLLANASVSSSTTHVSWGTLSTSAPRPRSPSSTPTSSTIAPSTPSSLPADVSATPTAVRTPWPCTSPTDTPP